ncbi:MAG: fibronectin type III domain-containing protein [Candidatus Kerfeldbacteria bacterium]|nr:fibronectin type III domain-containing protein [Candidatus Kerfeldbacteria bacterium]
MSKKIWFVAVILVVLGITDRTLFAASIPEPYHLRARQLTATSTVLVWRYDDPADYYNIKLLKGSGSSVHTFKNIAKLRKAVSSTFLHSNQPYQFKVQACVSEPASCTAYSSGKQFRTLPAKIGSLTVMTTDDTSVTFQVDSKPRGTITRYQARVKQGDTVVVSKKFTSHTTDASPQYSIAGLEASTDYTVLVRAQYDSDHSGVWSDAVAFTTADSLSVSTISPSTGYTDLETTIEITGTAFQDGAVVSIGDTAATTTTVNSSTSITAEFADSLSAGIYTVTVVNPDLTSASLVDAFTVSNPPAEWTKQNLSLTGSPEPLTSTCTILLPDNTTYRMYFIGSGGIWSITSTDGINWLSPSATNINVTGSANPNVLLLSDGTYLMIYGVQTDSPTTEKLFRATSTNGIMFTSQTGAETDGAVLVADEGEDNFVSVPELIDLGDGTIRMYFVASTSDSKIHTAISSDNGATWQREGEITLTGGSFGDQENDPDIIQLSDGSYRLFFTTPPAGQAIGDLRVRSAVSTDGRNFTLESGSRVTPSGAVNVLMDPDTILEIGTTDTYRLYYGANLTAGGADDLRAIVSN